MSRARPEAEMARPEAKAVAVGPIAPSASLSLPAAVLVAFVTGAAVMILELVGVRVLAPHYGVTIYTWTAMIGVTLVALGSGYAVGGYLADRKDCRKLLAVVLPVAGAWICLVPVLGGMASGWGEPLGIRGGVMAAAAALFFVPMGMLGMAVPLLIRMRVQVASHVGARSGVLLAASTAGSFAGTVAAGFYLIPFMDMNWLLVGIGVTAILAGGIAAARAGAGRARLIPAVAFLAPLAVAGGGYAEKTPDGLIHRRESLYGRIEVYGAGSYRELRLAGITHTTLSLDGHQELPASLSLCVRAASADLPEGGTVLLIGLGGGSIMPPLKAAGLEVDVAEIDSAVVEVASDYFGFESRQCRRVAIEDGRTFVGSVPPESYDAVIIDVLQGESVAEQLWTCECFAEIHRALSSKGRLAISLVGLLDPATDALLAALLRSIRESFEHVRILTWVDQPGLMGNFVCVASKEPLALRLEGTTWRDVTERYSLESASLLTDARNPASVWFLPIALTLRHRMYEVAGQPVIFKEKKR